jgi:hypothetical protein
MADIFAAEKDLSAADTGWPKMDISNVDLPAPFAPISATVSPLLTSRDLFQRLNDAVKHIHLAKCQQRFAHRVTSLSSVPR